MKVADRVCGFCYCRDDRACEGGCSWFQEPNPHVGICSRCVAASRGDLDGAIASERRKVAQWLCYAGKTPGELLDLVEAICSRLFLARDVVPPLAAHRTAILKERTQLAKAIARALLEGTGREDFFDPMREIFDKLRKGER